MRYAQRYIKVIYRRQFNLVHVRLNDWWRMGVMLRGIRTSVLPQETSSASSNTLTATSDNLSSVSSETSICLWIDRRAKMLARASFRIPSRATRQLHTRPQTIASSPLSPRLAPRPIIQPQLVRTQQRRCRVTLAEGFRNQYRKSPFLFPLALFT